MQSKTTFNKIRKAFKTTALALGFLSLFTGLANAQTYVNGNLSTGATAENGTAAPAGYTWSEVQHDVGNTTVANNTIGSGATGVNSIADDFTVTGAGWAISKLTVYGYSTNYTGTTSPFTALNVRIYNGNPSTGGTLVFGDMTTNVMSASSDALAYRISNTLVPAPLATNTARKIWKIEGNINVTLAPGTYWVEYRMTAGALGNFAPHSTPLGARTLPGYNAIQNLNGVWAALLDTGFPTTTPSVACDMPFSIDYSTGACSGTPAPGNTVASVTSTCSIFPVSFSLQNNTPGTGVTYQWQSGPSATGPWTPIAGATNSSYTANLAATAFYSAVVTCGASSTTSTPVQVTVTACYCTAGATSTTFEKISRVQFGSINNPSTATAGYEDFTAVSGNAYIGSTMPITVTISGGFAPDQVKVWIDFNRDFDFDDAGELVYTSANGVGPHTGNIVIPGNVTAGPTRMRVRMHDTSLGANGTPCGTSTYGQVEDYTVNLVPCVPTAVTTQAANASVACGANATFAVTLAGSDSSIVNWQYKTSAASTNWLDLSNTAPYSGVTTRTLTITGATSNLNGYQYRVVYKGACTGTSFSTPATLTVNPLVAAVTKTPAGNICLGGIQQLSITNTQPATVVTFSSAAALNITIPDDASTTGVSNVIAVSGIPAGVLITDIRIRMNLTHSWAGDMIVVAKAPNNNVLNLAYALNGTGGAGATTGFQPTFSKNATAFTSTGANPYTGVFAADGYDATTGDPTIPTGPNGFIPTSVAPTRNTFADLIPAAANSSTLNGNWTLAMYDYYDDFTTTNRFNNWSIEITYTGGLANGVWTSPTPNSLFTDAGATVAYNGTTPLNTVYAKPTATGVTNYTVVVNNGVCTSAAATVPVTVNQLATSVSAVANSSICQGGNASFTAASTGGAGNSLQWQVSTDNGATYTNITDGGVYSGATTGTLAVTGAGTNLNGYRYRLVASAAPCTGTVASTAGILTVNALPVLNLTANPSTAIYPGQTTTLAVASTTTVPANGYVWYRNGVVVPGATTNTLVVDVDGLGDYTVSVADANGCGNAQPASITISSAPNDIMFIYPSPNTGVFQVRYYSAAGNNPLPRTINIYDSKGARVYSKSYSVAVPYTRMDVDLSVGFQEGIYQVELTDRNGIRLKTGRVLIL